MPDALLDYAVPGVLCYVAANVAYFTTQALADQWGDDWNDAPYEHNAGTPYSPYRSAMTTRENVKPNHRVIGETASGFIEVSQYAEDGTPQWVIHEVRFLPGNLSTPDDHHANSPWCVQDINAGKHPWLKTSAWHGEAYTDGTAVLIPAGVLYAEFVTLVRKAGGDVLVPLTQIERGSDA